MTQMKVYASAEYLVVCLADHVEKNLNQVSPLMLLESNSQSQNTFYPSIDISMISGAVRRQLGELDRPGRI